MTQEAPTYKFSFLGDNENAYLFETTIGIIYQVKFTPTPYLFGEGSFYGERTFELSLLVGHNPTGRPPVFDRKTARTLAAVFSDFYQRSDETITLYICASDDGRQLLRQRLFHRWFDYFDRDDYNRVDAAFRDSSGATYPVTLILKQANPYGPEIAAQFLRVINGYGPEK